MKRDTLIRTVAKAARTAGLRWRFLRQGSQHEVWELDGEQITIPRHREINEQTARGILKQLESKLGKVWWRQ